ncbi:threonine/serine dehydratase [candidate division KSB1 bacterium]|nr:MAG: threonine/serine dehydratase [candidate division KSB1 bacterium]
MISALQILSASKRIKPFIIETPLEYSPYYSSECGGNIYFKMEHLQITGSFKLRGAFNSLMSLTPEEKENGIIAVSAGNHALGIAYVSTLIGVDSTIVLPENASKAKVDALKFYNVKLEFCGSDYDSAELAARKMEKETGKTMISGYNDKNVIMGQGTIGVEVMNRLPEVDIVLVPIGGGGLISGVAIYLKEINPNIQVIGVQTDTSPAMYESIKAGKIVTVEVKDTIADGLAGQIEKDSITFDIVKNYVNDILLVDEKEIKKAISQFLDKQHQLIEGSAAVIPAAILKYRNIFNNKNVVGVLSGRNIDLKSLKNILS